MERGRVRMASLVKVLGSELGARDGVVVEALAR